MKIKKIIYLILSVIVVLSFSSCGEEKVVEEKSAETAKIKDDGIYSGVLKPVSEEKVIPSATGQIIQCNYKIGDTVSSGALLYKLDDNGLSDSIATTKNAIAKANISINTAQENVNNLKIYAPSTGILHDFKIKKGEKVNAVTIGEIYDEGTVVALVPFNESQKNKISLGDAAVVTSSDLMASVTGKVTRIYDSQIVVDGAVLYNTEISIKNPGGLYKGIDVTAEISTSNGTVKSPAMGSINVSEPTSVVSKASGNAKVVNVRDGQRVTKGDLIVELENTSVTSQLERAKLDRSDLDIKLNTLKSDYEDLFIYSPAAGVITSMSKKNNDNIVSKTESIMTISNTNTLILDINISEEFLKNVKTGQVVDVKLDGKKVKSVSGIIKTVSKEAKIEGGAKLYPVQIFIINNYSLEPGIPAKVDLSK